MKDENIIRKVNTFIYNKNIQYVLVLSGLVHK